MACLTPPRIYHIFTTLPFYPSVLLLYYYYSFCSSTLVTYQAPPSRPFFQSSGFSTTHFLRYPIQGTWFFLCQFRRLCLLIVLFIFCFPRLCLIALSVSITIFFIYYILQFELKILSFFPCHFFFLILTEWKQYILL